ncbi:MAG TPA: ribosomal protein S18-alanine N-acetyltransferase [Candidatus Dormibacteraeota bacterium]|nr:ribosomal protein S18-alanine N-acetyltransferase [Candidatus Dormibacteraeota bacterium]
MSGLSPAGNCLIRKFQPQDAAALREIAEQSPQAAQWSQQSYEQLHNSGSATGVGSAVAAPDGPPVGPKVDPGIAPYSTSPITSHVLIWVVESAGRLCAFLVVRIIADEAEILNLAVKPVNRRQGIATRLLQTAIRDCIAAGAGRLFLEVRESNAGAIIFYEQVGFAKSGRRNRYYGDPQEAAVIMETKLTG